jgi:NAD(P)-dependent dehydrogenase (short-subunit alcohol dehydrogenase family)
MKLDGRVAIVTGGGRGIGRAIAGALAQEGARLVVAARTLSEVEETAAQIRGRGGRAMAVRADVSEPAEVEALVDVARGEFSGLDVLVNNAGIQGPIGSLMENDPDEWLRAIRVNLGAVFLCCRAVLPTMIGQRRGKIINLSGGGATSPRPRFSAYSVAKAGIVRLTETLAEELKSHNVQVNAIAPGAVYTSMTESVLTAGTAAGERALADARRVKMEEASPRAAAALAVFLASDESNVLTGRLISAVWDDWRGLPTRLRHVNASDLYTLRRVVEQP